MGNIGGFLQGYYRESSTKGQAKTTVEARQLTPEEREVYATTAKILGVELEQITRENEMLAEIFPEAKEILKALTGATGRVVEVFKGAVDALAIKPEETEFAAVSSQQALDVVQGRAPLLSQEEQAEFDQIFETERRRGEESLAKFWRENALTRGMSPRDSPISNPMMREVRELNEGIGAASAGARLQFGQERSQMKEAVRQFQEGLRFQAQQNRLALTGMSPFALQAPVSTVNPAQAAATSTGALSALIGRPTSSNVKYGQRTTGWGVEGGASVSTIRAKKSVLPLDPAEYERAQDRRGVRLPIGDEYDRALDLVRDTPIVRYRYKWEGDGGRAPHIGPILELSPEEIRETDTTVNLLDYTGLVHAGLKAVDRKVSRLALSLDEAPRKKGRLPL